MTRFIATLIIATTMFIAGMIYGSESTKQSVIAQFEEEGYEIDYDGWFNEMRTQLSESIAP